MSPLPFSERQRTQEAEAGLARVRPQPPFPGPELGLAVGFRLLLF